METGYKGVSTLQEVDKSVDELDSVVSYVTVMVVIRNMLKLDYMMQVNCIHVSECSFCFYALHFAVAPSFWFTFLSNEDLPSPTGKDCQCFIH